MKPLCSLLLGLAALALLPGGATAQTKVFRNIKVSVPSLSTVRVRARKGYYPANP